MTRYWDQIKDLSHDKETNLLPVVIAGDVFDKWNTPPEIINLAMKCFNGLDVYAVPGQHDLPNHGYDRIEQSAYWTLVHGGAIKDISNKSVMLPGNPLVLHGFQWERDLVNAERHRWTRHLTGNKTFHMAVCHRYCWMYGHSFPGVKQEDQAGDIAAALDEMGYDAGHFGDNHSGFINNALIPIANCGTLYRRRSDEATYRPFVSIFHTDGTFKKHYLDTSDDDLVEVSETETLFEAAKDYGAMLAGLSALGEGSLDFKQILKKIAKDVLNPRVAEMLLSLLEESDG